MEHYHVDSVNGMIAHAIYTNHMVVLHILAIILYSELKWNKHQPNEILFYEFIKHDWLFWPMQAHTDRTQ